MSGKKEQFSAVISLAAEMGGSVKSVFTNAKRETDKLGAAVNALYDKQKRVDEASRIRGGAQETKARLARLYAARQVAKAEAGKSSAGKTELANVKRLNAEIAKTEKVLNKERVAVLESSKALKRAGIDTKNLAAESARLASEIEKTDRKMQSRERWGKVGSRTWKTGAVVAGTAAGIVGGAFAIAKAHATESKELLALSRGLGMEPEYLQTYRKLGKGVGVEGGMVDSILTKTTKSIEKAQKGKGKEFDALRTLRINVAGLRKLKPEKQIEVIGNALNAYTGKANKSALMAALTGRGGPDVARFVSALSVGALGIEKLKKAGLESGLFETKSELLDSEKLANNLVLFGDQWKGLGNTISGAVTPAFTEFFGVVDKTIQDNMPQIREWFGEIGKALDQWVKSGDAKKEIKEFGTAIKDVVEITKTLVDKFGLVNTAATGLGLITFAPMLGAIGSAVIQSGLLLWRLNKIKAAIPAATAATTAEDVAGGAVAARVATGIGLGTAVTGAAALTIPFFISGDSRRPDSSKFKMRSQEERLNSSKAELAKAQAELDEQKRSRKEMYSPERGGLVGGWLHEKWYSGYVEYLEGKVKSLKESVAYNTPSLVPSSPLRRPPVINNAPVFNFNITAAPGQDVESFYGDVYSKIKQSYPALSSGMLHD